MNAAEATSTALFLLAVSVTGTVPLSNRITPDVSPFYYFDFNLVQKLSNNGKANWIASPVSIKTALGLLLEGSVGSTAQQISNTLHLPINVTRARHEMHDFLWKLKKPLGESGVEVKIATRLFTKQGSIVKDSYKMRALQYFGADAVESDFKKPWDVSNSINSWVSDSTNNYITQVIRPENIPEDSQLILVNAVYFKGDWKYGFDPRFTREHDFHTPGEKKKVKMMVTTGSLKSGPINELNSQIIELPYRNPRYSMVVLLPNADINLERLISDLPFNARILPFLDGLRPYDTDLLFPSFKITFNTDLAPILQKLGIVDIFTNFADLSDLLESKSSISSIMHQAKIEVTENGTVAGAATTVNVQLLSVSDKRKIIVNRPFLFFIRDVDTGFLFNGQVVDPSVEEVITLQGDNQIKGVVDNTRFEFPKQKQQVWTRG